MEPFSLRTANRQTHARPGMSTATFVVGLILWTLVLGGLYLVAVRRLASNRDEGIASQSDSAREVTEEAEPVEATQRTVIVSFPSRKLPDFEFPECMGDTVSLEKMKGKRWLANFVFTRCVLTCPQMTRDVSELHRRVAESNPNFEFVTFTVDPEYDTPEVLQKYAETFRADHRRWKFVTGDETEIHNFIRNGFVQFVQPNIGDQRLPGFEVVHSNRAVLVNEDGIPVGSFLMTVAEDVVRLRRIIEGKEEFPVPGAAAGALSISNGENPAVPLTLIPVKDTQESAENVPPQENQSQSGELQEQPPDATKATDDQTTPSENKLPQTPQAKNRQIDQLLPAWAARMPSINAGLNFACIISLIAGLAAIRAGHKTRHRNLMISSFVISTAFLISYLTYHQVLFKYTQFRGRAFDGCLIATRIYFSILIPHVVLAALVPILALRVFYLAFRERWPEHRWLARIAFPVWLFVSVTGVVIYGMLYHWPWPSASAPVSLVP